MSTDDPRDDFWRRPEPDAVPADALPAAPADALPDTTAEVTPDAAPAARDAGDPAPTTPDAPAPAAPDAGVQPPPDAPILPPGAPSRLQRLSGTVAVAAVIVVALFFALWSRTPAPATPTAASTPTPTSTVTPVAIPDEARTKVYKSNTPASNEFRPATLTIDPVTTAKTTNTYAVRVETTANVDADEAARTIQKVLDDPRGWAGFGNNNFRLVADAEAARLTITIASPVTADALCGAAAKTQGLYSCTVKNAVVINSDRWHYMVPTFNNLDEYRAYVVNHYTGQFLGQRIAFCVKKGAPAPAMARQDTNLDGCLPNAWPKLP